ncbi:UNVERIFIED_ORG: hypothetical protein ABIC58_001094 [Leuconostoc holzapfelii]|nr:hypothetical protein [Leuconostoc citreum]
MANKENFSTIINVTGLVDGFTALGVYINQQFIAYEDIRTVIREK